MPSCIDGTFYLDEDSDGQRQVDEPFLRSPDAPVSCSGAVAAILANLSRGQTVYADLPSSYCYGTSQPYFRKDLIEPGAYTFSFADSGWTQTSLQHLLQEGYTAISNPFTVAANERYQLLIGVQPEQPVVLSCAIVSGGTDPNDGDGGDPDGGDPDGDGDGDGGNGDNGGNGNNDNDPDGNDSDPDCTAAPRLTISNISTDLNACYEHELPQCGGLDENGTYRKPYTMIGYSLTLEDTCHPDELWFVNSYFKGALVQRDTRKNGDTWDVAINQSLSGMDGLWDDNFHGISSSGWTTNSQINNGATRTVSDSDEVSLTLCACTPGCMDTMAKNYNSTATMDDGSCQYSTYGCMDPGASNYDPSADFAGYCEYNNTSPTIYGCINPSATNYNPSAMFDDGTCTYDTYGCTDSNASNYDPTATMDNGSCSYSWI
jgi:hypothetical protein